MHQVRHLLETKGNSFYSIDPDAPVLEAIRQTATRGVGALLVTRADRLVRVVSERDYACKAIRRRRHGLRRS